MKKIKKIFLTIPLLFICRVMVGINDNLGEKFDVLMGKYDSPFFSAFMNPTSDPWCHDSNFAYCFSRSLFEKYSIESDRKNEGIKIPKIIHQIWLGGQVPAKYAEWMSTWQKYHPDWTYILWTDNDMQYLNLVNKDLFKKAKSFVEKADILRIELINMFGGIYVDTDYECLKPLDEFNYYNSFFVSSIPWGGSGFAVNNALIAASTGHPLIKMLTESIKHSTHYNDLSNRSGPIYFTRVLVENIAKYPKDVTVYPPCYLSPDPVKQKNDIHTYAIHWFDASWLRPQGLDKKIYKNDRLEKILTPFYFKKHISSRILQESPPNLPEHDYEIWETLFKKLRKRVVIELGVTEFLINHQYNLYDLHYIGISPVKFLTLEQRFLYNIHENRAYLWKDWLYEEIPECGLLIIGNSMECLPYKDCLTLLQKVADCDPEFFIIAHDPDQTNSEAELGQERLLNMCKAPFNLPQPDKVISLQKKTYGVWKNRVIKGRPL